jgi:deoxyribodipyrimidine photo-lyase
MKSGPIQKTRIKTLNDRSIAKGAYVLYWMQQSQRAEWNHALEFAVIQANQLQMPLLVCFGLTDAYPEANLRHYTFMLEGLQHTQQALEERGIKLVFQMGDPAEVALSVGRKAALIVCDCGYTRHQKGWRRKVADDADCRVVQVESDVVVPVEEVSTKAEYAARTIRPKIKGHLEEYLRPLRKQSLKHPSLDIRIKSRSLDRLDALLGSLELDDSVPSVSAFFPGGTQHAKRKFSAFIKNSLRYYDDHGNQPQTDDVSQMSPYLHFGQISPLYLALRVKKQINRHPDAVAGFLEQITVRRELAVNFVNYTTDYDAFTCLPDWARKTLSEHRGDKRTYRYSRRKLEDAATHDPYWNAAQLEMRHTGFMHNYMRMYWGKKILEWTADPQNAFETTLAINNKYFLDGRDPNSFVGVAWIYGIHDRAWSEREIFGKVRYMAASGLERKCDIQAYVEKVNRLVKKASS